MPDEDLRDDLYEILGDFPLVDEVLELLVEDASVVRDYFDMMGV